MTDNLSGVDNATIETRIDHSDKGDVEVKGSTLNFRSLPDGSYKLQVSAKDNSDNEANEIITVKIDTTAPNVNGVKDQSAGIIAMPVRGEISRPGSEMPNIPMSPKQKSVGYQPSCFPGLISMAFIHPPGTMPPFPPWPTTKSALCSLN